MNIAPVLSATRVELRPLTAADVDAVLALWTDPVLRRLLWNGELVTAAQVLETIAASTADFASRRFGLWGLYARADDALVGFFGARSAPGSAPELVYGLRPAWWGKGLASEAGVVVLEYLFTTLGHAEVQAATDPPNRASMRLLERIGMTFQHQAAMGGVPTLFYHVRRDAWLRHRAAKPSAT